MTAFRQVLIAAVLMLAACAPVYRNHGYIPPAEDLAMVTAGQTTVNDLPGLIGRPSAQGLLTGSAWYYVGSRWRYYGPTPPQEVQRQVVAISFTDTGVVSNVERFGLERGRVVVLSRQVTDAGVSSVSVIRQILGSVGNFNPGQIFN